MLIEVNKKINKYLKKLLGLRSEAPDALVARMSCDKKAGTATFTVSGKSITVSSHKLLPLIGLKKRTFITAQENHSFTQELHNIDRKVDDIGANIDDIDTNAKGILRKLVDIRLMIDDVDDTNLKSKTTVECHENDVPVYCPFIIYDSDREPIYVMKIPFSRSLRYVELSTGKSLEAYLREKNLVLAYEYSQVIYENKTIKHPEYKINQDIEVCYLPWQNLKDFVD